MGDFRDPHFQAVGFAGLIVQELEIMLAVARDKADDAVGAVYAAVGPETTVDSARNALEHIASVRDKIPEMIAQTEVVKAELNRYSSGF
jgi:hypothetical protein